MYFRNIISKIKLPFRKDKELYRRLYIILGFYPKNISYYRQALLHKSLSVKNKNGKFQNNERLEFLGDAILDAIVGDIVYHHFENKSEGFLTNARSKIVQRETLGKLAVEMGLDKLIRYNQHQNNSHNSYMAGNAFEALVGAIYLDYGYDQCMRFMERRILNHIIDIDKVAYKEVNFKSKLLEWSQKNRIKVTYKDLPQQTDKNGASQFNTVVVIEGIECGQGKGYSKKESQQLASKETLYMLKKHKEIEESVFLAKSKRTAMEEQPEALLPDIPEHLLNPSQSADRKSAKKEPRREQNEPKEQVKVKEQNKAKEQKEHKKPTGNRKPKEQNEQMKPADNRKPKEQNEQKAVDIDTDNEVKPTKPKRHRCHHKPASTLSVSPDKTENN